MGVARIHFEQPQYYRPSSGKYRLCPFRFMRWPTGEVLVVNEVGEHLFLDRPVFDEFVTHRLSPSSSEYLALKGKHLLLDSGSTVPIDLLAAKYRTKKNFLEGFTKLHLFVVTLRCDHSCAYCQVSRANIDKKAFDMSRSTARKAVDLMLCSPAKQLKVEFQGGESLLNFDLIKYIVEYTQERNQDSKKQIEYVVATNLSPLTDQILSYLKEHSILVSTSLDGPSFIHNRNRPRPGNDSYEITIRNMKWAKEVLGEDRVAALMTTTTLSLKHPREIIDEYVRQGFGSIFLRPISPYGFAIKSKSTSDYSIAEFLEFYKTGLDYIVELNRQGTQLTEIYTQILLTRILTPFTTGYVDLQSPAGAAISVVAYNYDGDVYASDEARMLVEMGDKSFRLGNVHEDGYAQIFGGELVRSLVESSCVETLPGCADCAFQTFCGADPVFNYATQGDIVGHRPTSIFCRKNMTIIKHLFDLMREGDRFTKALLTSWATHVYPDRSRCELN